MFEELSEDECLSLEGGESSRGVGVAIVSVVAVVGVGVGINYFCKACDVVIPEDAANFEHNCPYCPNCGNALLDGYSGESPGC